MCTVASAMLRRALTAPRTPLVLLALVSVLSLGARALMLDEPCASPCNKAGDHTLIFDEAYYVNAARVIAGLRPPPGAHYADAPLGTDPNAEHPQLAKLIMAGAIELFGDGPFAWRIGSLIFGSIAILGMYALVRAAGGGRWSALCAATLMACDNLALIHGRIGTLDIYTVAMMIWGVALYLRGWPVRAGIALGIGAAFKLVAPYAAAILFLLEAVRVLTSLQRRGLPAQWRPWPALRRLVVCVLTGIVVFLAALTVMDQIATPYADATAQLITGGPFAHLWHMITYAAQQSSPHGPQGIASYPWAWLIDLKPIVYLRINPSAPSPGLGAIHPVSKFIGMISPPILLLALPGLLFCAYRVLRSRDRPEDDIQLAAVSLAWFLGSWIPFAFLSLVDQRTSYLYYMVIVVPGLYLAATYLVSHAWRTRNVWLRRLAGFWMVLVVAAVVLMYPFVPVF